MKKIMRRLSNAGGLLRQPPIYRWIQFNAFGDPCQTGTSSFSTFKRQSRAQADRRERPDSIPFCDHAVTRGARPAAGAIRRTRDVL